MDNLKKYSRFRANEVQGSENIVVRAGKPGIGLPHNNGKRYKIFISPNY